MAELNNCPHCGAGVEFVVEGGNAAVFAQCTNCKIRTLPVSGSLDYSAKDKVAGVWNSSNSVEWPEWIQPKGAHDAYFKGSKVTHGGKMWISNADANVWEPGMSGWTEYKGGAV